MQFFFQFFNFFDLISYNYTIVLITGNNSFLVNNFFHYKKFDLFGINLFLLCSKLFFDFSTTTKLICLKIFMFLFLGHAIFFPVILTKPNLTILGEFYLSNIFLIKLTYGLLRTNTFLFTNKILYVTKNNGILLKIKNKNSMHECCQLNRREVMRMHIKEDNEDVIIYMHANSKLKKSYNC